MQKLHILVLLLVIVTAEDSFLEKQKHVKQQKDLATEIYTIKKKGTPTFLGMSTDDSLKEQLQSLMTYEEALKLTPEEGDHTIKFIESMYIIDQPNPNAIRATESPKYLTEFPKHVDDFSTEKLTTFREDCIYLFSECNFKGKHAKSCPGHHNSFLGLSFEVLSIKMPERGSMTLLEEKGSTAYHGNNKCLRSNPLNFMYVDGKIQQSFGEGSIFIGA